MMSSSEGMTTFKFRLTDGTGGTYRTDKEKTVDEARKELDLKYGVKVAIVTLVVPE